MMNIEAFEAMAKLSLTENERDRIGNRIDSLMQGFDELAGIDTSNVEPMMTVLDIHNVLREDVAVKNISREDIMSNAPEQYDGYFQVPKTLD